MNCCPICAVAVASLIMFVEAVSPRGGPRKMILIDQDLDPDPKSRNNAASALAPKRSRLPWHIRIPSKPTLRRFLNQARAAVRLRGDVSVLLTTDQEIRRLNRQFRGIDSPTDVLSFPPAGPCAQEIAGDLALSVETARRQAADHGHALACELKILILHGLLHLAGYDHEADEGRMARRERKLRAQLRLPIGLIERADGRRRPKVSVLRSERSSRSAPAKSGSRRA